MLDFLLRSRKSVLYLRRGVLADEVVLVFSIGTGGHTAANLFGSGPDNLCRQ